MLEIERFGLLIGFLVGDMGCEYDTCFAACVTPFIRDNDTDEGFHDWQDDILVNCR